ncbi:DUF3795 domain-containing protein [Labilibacter marinus]|uniref:DUF3795 domain-containing protein n=1 Tax=Labilibacter marinus TaxID=1477105 RepID=UPI00094F6E9F|nr:DUF3795 domain-containing protein [Labilibacter marinus]
MTKLRSVQDPKLVAFCGLYCGTCRKYLKGKCPGCNENTKATWCTIRDCNLDNKLSNCSQCNMEGIEACKKLNNPIGKVFEFVFRTDRLASLKYIAANGEQLYSEKMCSLGLMSIKKRQTI